MISLGMNSQYLNLEMNFKTKILASSTGNTIAKDLNGNYFAVDSNADGNIDITEAENVSELDLSNSNIDNLNGVFANKVTNIDFSKIQNVEQLYCSANLITDIQGSSNMLKFLMLANNNLATFNIHNFPNLEELSIGYYICSLYKL